MLALKKLVKSRSFATVRLIAINDVYELDNLPKLNTFLSHLYTATPAASVPHPSAVIIAGDFISPSTLSSIDSGRGMVASLRAAGVTHAILGNHEGDVKLNVLAERVRELSRSCVVINSNMCQGDPANPADNSWLVDTCPSHAVVSSQCGEIQLALLGLLSDEEGIFRDNTFKGIPISNVCETVSALSMELKDSCHLVVPVTHQSATRDRELAETMHNSGGLIIGGHDHIVMNECHHGVHIVKSGQDAQQCAVVDLSFDDKTKKLEGVKVAFEPLGEYEDCGAVLQIVEKQKSVIKSLENEVILDAGAMFPGRFDEQKGGSLLSSLRTRHEQTSMGAVFCQAMKSELDADVAIINGASIKGDTSYPSGLLSYADLKKELPFPAKMIVVSMPAKVLKDAVEYSRSAKVGSGTDVDDIPRKGFLQTDFDFWETAGVDLADDMVLHVALPRNLLGGFCRIEPLMEFNKVLQSGGSLPSDDHYIPALDLVTRYCCKEQWMAITQKGITFEDMDQNHDGVVDRSEVAETMRRVLGHEVEDFVVDGMMEAIDADGSGSIDHEEFDQLLAQVKRWHPPK